MSLLFNPTSGRIHQALFYVLVVFMKKWVYIRRVKMKIDVHMTNNVVSGVECNRAQAVKVS